MKSLKLTFLTLLSSFTLALVPAVAFALNPDAPSSGTTTQPTQTTTSSTTSASTPSSGGTPQSDACDALHQLDSTKDCSGGDTGVTNIVSAIVNILSIIVGIAAVIMIIIAALKYVTASGDAGAISSAKSTLIYALIGLFIAALAQFLVHFVISTANKA